jgi:hypothetical protein
VALLTTYFHTDILLYLFCDPEDGGDMFLRNVGYQRTTLRFIPEGSTFQVRGLFNVLLISQAKSDFNFLMALLK